MIFILSSQYINEEYNKEFGEIPPAFLPIQNSILLNYQLETLSKFHEKIVITLPKGFIISHCIDQLLKMKNIDIIYLDSNMSLLKLMKKLLTEFNENVYRFYYGDTLVRNIKTNHSEYCYISRTYSNNSWFHVGRNKFFSGYFQFINKKPILEYIKTSVSLNSFLELLINNHLKNIQNDEILDFGNLNTYFKNKMNFITSRSFNNIRFSKNTIIKTSEDSKKIQAEINWYRKIPENMKIYSGRLISSTKKSYTTEYLPALSLNEYFLNSKISKYEWNNIFSVINQYLDTVAINATQYSQNKFANDYKYTLREALVNFKKYIDNLNFLCSSSEILINKKKYPSINKFIDKLQNHLYKHKPIKTIIHGDFSLSNIFYDSRTNQIKLIDPRGLNLNNKVSIYGDINYEYAKFAQFYTGYYDSILSGNYMIKQKDNSFEFKTFQSDYQKEVIKYLKKHSLYKNHLSKIDINLVKYLYLSMLSKHSENKIRQLCFLITSMEIS